MTKTPTTTNGDSKQTTAMTITTAAAATEQQQRGAYVSDKLYVMYTNTASKQLFLFVYCDKIACACVRLSVSVGVRGIGTKSTIMEK